MFLTYSNGNTQKETDTETEKSISSIFDKFSMLQQTQSQPNHTSNTKVYFNEVVANALRDNIGSKKSASGLRKENMRLFFSFLIVSDCMVYLDPKFLMHIYFLIFFKYQKFRVRVNHTIIHNQHNQTQWHKVNDFDFRFVSKCLHISNYRTKPTGLDF